SHFALAFVKSTGAGADAAKIKTNGGHALLQQRTRQHVNDLVLKRTAVQRMRMADHGEVSGCGRRRLDQRLQRAGGPAQLRLFSRRWPRAHLRGAEPRSKFKAAELMQ